MQKIINDSLLGRIEYSEDYDLYEGKIKNQNGEVVEFSFDVDNNFEETIEFTRQILKQLEDRSYEFRLYAAEKLLDLYNNTWSQNEIINQNEFANRISIESIMIWSDGNSEIYYRDSNLFAGHSIVVHLNSRGELKDANIAG